MLLTKKFFEPPQGQVDTSPPIFLEKIPKKGHDLKKPSKKTSWIPPWPLS